MSENHVQVPHPASDNRYVYRPLRDDPLLIHEDRQERLDNFRRTVNSIKEYEYEKRLDGLRRACMRLQNNEPFRIHHHFSLLDDTFAEMYSMALMHNKSLRTLLFTPMFYDFITLDAAYAFCKALRSCNVTELRIQGNILNHDNRTSLFKAISLSSSITRVAFSCNCDCSETLDRDNSIAVGELLSKNLRLQQLRINVGESIQGAKRLAEGISDSDLTRISITRSGWRLGRPYPYDTEPSTCKILEGVRNAMVRSLREFAIKSVTPRIPLTDLAEGLQHSMTMKHLKITHSKLDKKSMELLGQALKLNRSLINLILTHNDITDMTLAKLIPGLTKKSRLLNLDLTMNCINNSVIEPFMLAIADMPSLKRLDLSFNPLGSEGLRLIGISLPTITLETINLSDHGAPNGFGEGSLNRNATFDTELKAAEEALLLGLEHNHHIRYICFGTPPHHNTKFMTSVKRVLDRNDVSLKRKL